MPPLNPFAPEWKPPSALVAEAGVVVRNGTVDSIECFDLAGLPAEVIASVLTFLDSPRDLASCICSCTLLKHLVNEAELRLDMRNCSISRGNAEEMTPSRLQSMIGFLKYAQGTAALILPNVPLEDSDVECILSNLPRLQLLDVSGGRKLTHASASLLANTNAAVSSASNPLDAASPARKEDWHSDIPSGSRSEGAQPSDLSGDTSLASRAGRRLRPVRVLNLQRCFQLHSGSLDELLASPDTSILALSHLDLGRWPGGPGGRALLPAAGRSHGTKLQVLTLHNCLRLHGGAIAALASAGAAPSPPPPSCPDPLDPASATTPTATTTAPSSSSSSLSFLLLGGSTLALASFVGGTPPPPALPPRLEALLDRAYRPALTYTAATVQAHLAAARHLAAAVLALPRLVALELTFFPPPLVECLRQALACPEATGRQPVEVWDFATNTADVQRAGRTLRRHLCASAGPQQLSHHHHHHCSSSSSSSGGGGGGYQQDTAVGAEAPLPGAATAGVAVGPLGAGGVRDDDGIAGLAVSTLLRCAVNCSSTTRSTPLHLAAERGNAAGVAGLLAAGAVVEARDTGGSTALFLAAEAGHTAVLELLLGAGSDPRLGNAAGETPLYIAALRGHLGCVRALLAHCEAQGIAWQDPELYGDAWTPLHAAAVANRADVAACLLQAAGSSGAGDLVIVPNKYGQSVLHIAARKGSAQLLRLLLSAGGVAVVGSRDGSGDTPVDVAKKNRHVAALAEFRRLTGGPADHGGSRGQRSATAVA